MIELKGNDRGVEARVHSVQNGTGHRHTVVRFDHRRRIGEHDRYGIALTDPALRKRGCQPPRALVKPTVRRALAPMDHRDMVGMDHGGPFEQCQGRQRLMIGRRLVEIAIVLGGHGVRRELVVPPRR